MVGKGAGNFPIIAHHDREMVLQILANPGTVQQDIDSVFLQMSGRSDTGQH